MEEIVTAVGARPIIVDAKAHDEQVAYTSHLPQLLSTALSLTLTTSPTGSEAPATESCLRGPGLAGMLRLAESDERLWSGILLANSEHVLTATEAFRDRLDELSTAIRSGNAEAIENFMRQARQEPS